MVESRLTRVLLRLGAGLTLAFLYVPLFLIALYAFNESVTQSWPIDNFSTKWFSVAYHNEGIRDAHLHGLVTSTCLQSVGFAYDHAVREVLPTCPSLGVGIHLNLVECRPWFAGFEQRPVAGSHVPAS